MWPRPKKWIELRWKPGYIPYVMKLWCFVHLFRLLLYFHSSVTKVNSVFLGRVNYTDDIRYVKRSHARHTSSSSTSDREVPRGRRTTVVCAYNYWTFILFPLFPTTLMSHYAFLRPLFLRRGQTSYTLPKDLLHSNVAVELLEWTSWNCHDPTSSPIQTGFRPCRTRFGFFTQFPWFTQFTRDSRAYSTSSFSSFVTSPVLRCFRHSLLGACGSVRRLLLFLK